MYLCWKHTKKPKNVITGIRNHWKGEELRAVIKAAADSVTKETLAKITKRYFSSF
jgi:predicted transposase YbfD/YdcC